MSRINFKKSPHIFLSLNFNTGYRGRASDLTVPGLGHSVIRGLVTDRLMVPPRALRSKNVDLRRANIGGTQIARTLQGSQPLTDTDRYSIVFVLAAGCSLLLIAA